jgi:hypothetical protein
MELTESNIANLRKILDDFGNISGLRCNYEKTQIMPIGMNNVIPENLHGFVVANKIRLLGFDLSSDLNLLPRAFDAIKEKIVSLILFWERFKLTLPGRISIIKTLLLPQLNYLGSFLTPEDSTLAEIQNLLDKFALDRQIMSPNRRYLSPELGGGGLD